jgi:hypothetical protein
VALGGRARADALCIRVPVSYAFGNTVAVSMYVYLALAVCVSLFVAVSVCVPLLVAGQQPLTASQV